MSGIVRLFLTGMLLWSPVADALTTEEEAKRGQEDHKKIIAQFGVYRDQALQDYVDRVGQRIAAQSSRPDLEYHFTVLDSEIVNAMAIVGGYVYVTRGMLMHLNSESELAAVLGHEIAHVTEKHLIRSENRAKTVGALATAAAILAPGMVAPNAVYDLGELFGGVLLKGYSREFELEADEVGARYMAKAGYSPDAMLKTIEILKNKDRVEMAQARAEKREPNVYHGFLSTHPDHDKRYEEAIRESSRLLADFDEFITYDEFLEKLNGLAWGNSKQVGVVRKNVFYHPGLGIKLTFPEAWRIASTPQGIEASSPVGDARFALSTGRIAGDEDPRSYVEHGIEMNLREGREVTIGDLPGFIGIAERANTPFGPRPARVTVLFDRNKRRSYIMIGAGQFDLHRIAADKDFIKTVFSFDLMSREDRQAAIAPRIQIVRAEEGTTMADLAADSPITNYALEKLRVINGLYPDGEPEPGQLIKIVD